MTDAHNIAQVELLPCPNPWCGGHIYDLQHRVPLWRVVCACGVKGPTAYSIEDAAAAWNTRPAPSAVVDALREAEKALRDIVNPVDNLRRYAEAKGRKLGPQAYAIANDLSFVQGIAKAALTNIAALANTPKQSAGLVEELRRIAGWLDKPGYEEEATADLVSLLPRILSALEGDRP